LKLEQQQTADAIERDLEAGAWQIGRSALEESRRQREQLRLSLGESQRRIESFKRELLNSLTRNDSDVQHENQQLRNAIGEVLRYCEPKMVFTAGKKEATIREVLEPMVAILKKAIARPAG